MKEYKNIYRSEVQNPKEVMRCVKGEINTLCKEHDELLNNVEL